MAGGATQQMQDMSQTIGNNIFGSGQQPAQTQTQAPTQTAQNQPYQTSQQQFTPSYNAGFGSFGGYQPPSYGYGSPFQSYGGYGGGFQSPFRGGYGMQQYQPQYQQQYQPSGISALYGGGYQPNPFRASNFYAGAPQAAQFQQSYVTPQSAPTLQNYIQQQIQQQMQPNFGMFGGGNYYG